MVNVNGCTCPPTPGHPEADGSHTSSVESTISDETLRVLIGMETCVIERRALERVLVNRHRHVA